MTIDLKSETHPPEVQSTRPQLKVRSDLRAGADCEEGLSYWKSEYNYWKNLAQSMGCA